MPEGSVGSGTRVGPYEVVELIGAGGMGEVYRATDTKLNRQVALKVLPGAVAADPERLARFRREAQVLAALNHPNIAHIHGFEETSTLDAQDGLHAIVMELVEGPTLADLIAAGQPEGASVSASLRDGASAARRGGGAPRGLSVDDAIAVARQIAEALEAAHEQGIIHRDLKPANVKVRDDGVVKVLDFGLAKAMDPTGGSSADAMNSPTLTARATQMGVILGTAAYMAPEQARGKTVDRRADIWAFGCVLYEMLTGRRTFEGEDISVTLANVIKDEVDWQALPADVPAPIRHLLGRCLEKDPRRRLRDIGEARVTLEDPASAAPATREPVTAGESPARPVPPRWRRVMPLAATAVIVSAIAGVLFWRFQPPPAATPIVTRFSIVLPADQSLTRPNYDAIAVSPDGTRVVYVANRQLYLREMGEAEARPIPGTSVDPAGPFFSPDGQWVGFASARDAQLQKIAITGGSPVTLCAVDALPFGASWAGDTVVFAGPSGVLRVSENGGEPEVVVSLTLPELAYGPQMLDEEWLMFTLATGFDRDRWDTAQIVVQSLATDDRRVVVRGGSAARFVPTGLTSPSRADRSRGHVVYAVGNTLRAVPFDLERREVLGSAAPVVEQVARAPTPTTQGGAAQYGVSATGALAFVPGVSSDADQLRALALVGIDGDVEPIALPAQPYIHPRLSPDGRRLAVATEDGRNADVYVYDLAAGGALQRLTFGGRNLFPIWTPDGRFITYQSDRDGDLAVYRQLADGSGPAERLTKPDVGVRHEPESWSADGSALSINVVKDGDQSVWLFPVDPQAPPQALADSTVVEKHSALSPDGRWVAYMSSAGGAAHVFVQPLPPSGAKYQVSAGDGGRTPAWSPDGKRLFFHSPVRNQFFVVDLRPGPALAFSAPELLPIEGTIHPIQQRNYDVTPDGKRLLVVLPAAGAATEAVRDESGQINIVLHWFEELRVRAPAK